MLRSARRLSSSAATARVSRWLAGFEDGLASGSAHESFSSRCFWRDMVAFT